jgi:hypothetical protein
MKRNLWCVLGLAGLCGAASAPTALAHDVVERRSFDETLHFAGGQGLRRVEVDNYWGPVSVIGEERDDVALAVREVITADDAARLAEARRDVRLERSSEGNTVRIEALGPFRRRDGRERWGRSFGYCVRYALEVRVPSAVALLARTVSDGDVRVEGVRGLLEVHNVNGSVRALRVAGSGTFGTVNGDLAVGFAANPTAPSTFENVNGDIDVEFQPGLGAQANFRTLNGEIWSDFPYTALPARGEVEKQQGRFVYRSRHAAAVRIAEGGPDLRFETVNGEIRLRQRAR